MKSVEIGRFGKCRLWVDEAIEVGVVPDEVTERHVAAGLGNVDARTVAVEVYLPRGARVEYALLGMRYEPASGRDLVVRILVGEPRGCTYEQSLAGHVDEVYAGLPTEYVQGVLEATCEEATGRLGPGVLVVDQAAHGVVGSSLNLFEQLARLVVRLIIDPHSSEEQLSMAFQPVSDGWLERIRRNK